MRDWMQKVTDALNTLPPFSTFSHRTPESVVSAIPGTIGVNLHTAHYPHLWIKDSGDTTVGWAAVSHSVAGEDEPAPDEHVGYGGLVDNYSTVRITGIATDYVKIYPYQVEFPSLYVDSNATSGTVTVRKGGHWRVGMQSSFSGVANTEYHIGVFRNDTELKIETNRKLGTGGDVGSCSFVGIASLTSGDVLDLRVNATSGSGNYFGVQQMQFVVDLLHAT